MTEKILVVGASGKTGRRLVPLLRRRGAALGIASRSRAPGTQYFDWNVEASWQAAVEGVDAVYLVAPEMVEDPSEGIGAFLDLARRTGVKTAVLLSSLGVTFPREPALSGRLKSEMAVQNSGLRWTILRPSGFFQNFTEGFFAPGIAAGEVRTATGDGKAAWVDAGDIAAMAAAALTGPGHDGRIYAVTGPRALSVAEALTEIGAARARDIGYAALSEQAFRSMMREFGLPEGFADVVVRDQIAIRDGFGAAVSADVELVLGRQGVDFAQFVRREIAPMRGS